MLDDEETYKPRKTNPTASTTEDVNKFINNLLESNKITKEASFRLKISDATTPPDYTDDQNYTKKTSLSDP